MNTKIKQNCTTTKLSKEICIISILAVLLIFFSCEKNNPIKSDLSIVEQINESRPYETINISYYDYSHFRYYTYNNENGISFTDAYAEGENLVIENEELRSNYYSLLTVREVEIHEKTLYLKY